MVLLTDLAPELLSRIAYELYTKRDPESGIYFGPAMRSLALSCKILNLACYPYRFRDWELITESYKALEEHRLNEKWRKTVRKLLVPIIDLRTKKEKKKRSLDAYDAKLAEVVRSAEGLISLGFSFESFAEDSMVPENIGKLPLLGRTLQACRDRKGIKRLSFRGISFPWQAEAACEIFESWPDLHGLELYRGTGDHPDELQLAETLYAGAAPCKDLKELVFDMPMFLNVGPERKAIIPKTEHSLTYLDLGDFIVSHPLQQGSAVRAILVNSMATLQNLSIWTETLDSALLASPSNLTFPNLRQVHLKVALGDTQKPWLVEQGSDAVSKLRKMLSSSSCLTSMHISGSASFALLAHLLYDYRNTFRALHFIIMDVGFADPASHQKEIAAISAKCIEQTGIDIEWVDGEEALLG